ncbi:hypothetical protein, partial [Salmonella enterica]|uniref:hypothetical protein n=1 Tax=Salmonella enterica TaxID=28901 RepID=UPI0019616900
RWVRLNSVIITFSGFKSGTCQRYSGRVKDNKKADIHIGFFYKIIPLVRLYPHNFILSLILK